MNLIYYRHNKKEPMLAMEKNPISCHELTLIFNGSTQYEVNAVKYPLSAGDIIYVSKGSTRSRLPLKDVDYVSLNFYSGNALGFPVKMENGISDIIQQLINTFDSIYKYTTNLNDPRFEALLDCLLLQIETQISLQTENPVVANVKKYVKENYSQKITLADIAAHVYLSPVYCESVFRKETGKSVIDYLIDERIKIAKNMLWEGGIPLKKIALAVGFTDYNYFCRTFKKRTGYAPLQYRKRQLTFDYSNTD